jgi:hypothetical protein
MGLPDIGEDAAYRLSLAAELIGAGAAPRELARELGFDPPADLLKYNYNPDEARVPAGSGYGSGEWGAAVSPLTEGRSAGVSLRSKGANSGKVNVVRDLPKDAIVVTRPDGTTIDDPHKEAHGSATGKFPGCLCGWKTNIRQTVMAAVISSKSRA